MKGDNEGKNVSVLNPYINEHTVIYWVGQHLNEIQDDYIGFCHYRRYFDIPENEKIHENTIYINQMNFSISNTLYYLINHDPNVCRTLSEFIQKFMRSTDQKTLNQFFSFLDSKILFSGNMFIMHRNKFKEYMKIIIPIYQIIFNMIYPFPNVADRSTSFLLGRITSFIILKMAQDDSNIKIKQGNYIKLGDIAT